MSCACDGIIPSLPSARPDRTLRAFGGLDYKSLEQDSTAVEQCVVLAHPGVRPPDAQPRVAAKVVAELTGVAANRLYAAHTGR